MSSVGITVKKELDMATFTKRDNGKWQAKIRRKGYKTQTKTFATKKDAKRWVREVETEMDQSTFKSTDAAKKKQVAKALEQYWEEALADKKSSKSIKYMSDRIKKVFEGFSLLDVSIENIREYKNYRLETVVGDTVRKELGHLERMFKYAINEWQIHLPNGNPVTPISLPPKGKARDRRLPRHEQAVLITYAEQYDGKIDEIITLAIETAMRQGEIVNGRSREQLNKWGYSCMCWENFDEVSSTVLLVDTKNGERRTVPLSSRAKKVILAQPRKASGPIFDTSVYTVGGAFRKVVERAGIKNLRFHDLRHEATSRLFEETTLNMMEIAAITGHKDLASLKRYTHLCPKRLAEKLG